MIATAMMAATAVVMGAALWLLEQCAFLAPYRDLLWRQYSTAIGGWASVFFVNVFALFYLAGRALSLDHTGRKLAHLEKQLRRGPSISEELSRLLDS